MMVLILMLLAAILLLGRIGLDGIAFLIFLSIAIGAFLWAVRIACTKFPSNDPPDYDPMNFRGARE